MLTNVAADEAVRTHCCVKKPCKPAKRKRTARGTSIATKKCAQGPTRCQKVATPVEENCTAQKLHATGSNASLIPKALVPGALVTLRHDITKSVKGAYGVPVTNVLACAGSRATVVSLLQKNGSTFVILRSVPCTVQGISEVATIDQENFQVFVSDCILDDNGVSSTSDLKTTLQEMLRLNHQQSDNRDNTESNTASQRSMQRVFSEVVLSHVTVCGRTPELPQAALDRRLKARFNILSNKMKLQWHQSQPTGPPSRRENLMQVDDAADGGAGAAFKPVVKKVICVFDENHNTKMMQHAKYAGHQHAVYAIMIKQFAFRTAMEGWDFHFLHPIKSRRAPEDQ